MKTKSSKGSDELIVEWKNNTIAARSAKLTTISVVYETVKLILKDKSVTLDPTSRPTEEELEQYYELVEQFYNTLLEGLQPYKEALIDSSQIPQMRKDEQPYSLLFKPIGQLALFRGLIAATRNNRLSLSEAVERANKIDWRINSDIWKNFLVAPSGTMLRGEQPPVQTGKLIEYMIAADKMIQQDIEAIHREYNVAHGVDINDSDVELMPLPKPVVEQVSSLIEALA